MDELRVIRREDDTLILANDLGEEFRLVVDEVAASEFRQLSRRPASNAVVKPREIQSLLRSGKTRAEVAQLTGAEESDVERFEGPVRAEQVYILELAHAVAVRTDPHHGSGDQAEDQRFGEVIVERLETLGSVDHEWRSWRDEESGWHVGLLFHTHEAEHDAIWAFDHRKHILSPLSVDATHLSKAGNVGDQLIPKLRAVDNAHPDSVEPFDQADSAPVSGVTPAASEITERTESSENTGGVDAGGTASAGPNRSDAPQQSGSDEEAALSPEAEYERRREIDQLAINTPAGDADDLNQTADLLDALRKRRGERAAQLEQAIEAAEHPDLNLPASGSTLSDEVLGHTPAPTPKKRPSAATNIWGASGVSADESGESEGSGEPAVSAVPSESDTPADEALQKPVSGKKSTDTPGRQAKPPRKGRSSIPSWDDILFGTRSDDDPA